MLLNCCCDCVILEDDFTRDSTGATYGATWSVESGAWQIESGHAPACSAGSSYMLTTGDANALMLITQAARSLRHAAFIGFGELHPGDAVRLYVGYKDSSNHTYIQIVGGQYGAQIVTKLDGSTVEDRAIYDDYVLCGIAAYVRRINGQNCLFVAANRSSEGSLSPGIAPTSLLTSDFQRPFLALDDAVRIGVGTGGTITDKARINYFRAYNISGGGATCYSREIECTACIDGLAASWLQVAIDGPDAVSAGDNGTFDVFYGRGEDSFNASGLCEYHCQDNAPYGYPRVQLGGIGGAGLYVQTEHGLQFRLLFAESQHCLTFSNINVPALGGSDATCTITAIQ